MSIYEKMFGKSTRTEKDSTGTRGEANLTIVEDIRRPLVWAVGGGKGGVGKSFVTSNLAIMLTGLGHRVLAIDADLGAANLHTFLGISGSRLSLSSFLKSEVNEFDRMIKETNIERLDIISGANDSLDVADLNHHSLVRLKKAIENIDYDYILLDIGPGTSSNMLDLFLTADEGIIITTPEPTSIENTYRYLKCLLLRRIRNIINSEEKTLIKERLQRVFNGNWSKRIRTVADIMHQLRRISPDQEKLLEEFMGGTRLSLLVNQASSIGDAGLGDSMTRACLDYFGVRINHLGEISTDMAVTESVRTRRPVALHYKTTEPFRAFETYVKKLTEGDGGRNFTRACT